MAPVPVFVADQFLQPDGATPDAGTLRIRPLVPLRFSDSPLTIGASWREYLLDAEGQLGGDPGIPLIANDSPAILPENTCWLVQFRITNASFDSAREWPFILYADDADGDPVNLAARIRETLDLQPIYVYALESALLAHEADRGLAGHAAHFEPDNTTIVVVDGKASAVGGTGDKHYVHPQLSPATVWTIDHNLNKHPTVTIVDSAGSVYEAQIEYPSLNQAIARMSAAFAGTAYCN